MEIKWSSEGKMMSHIRWHFQINIIYQEFIFKSLKTIMLWQTRLETRKRDDSRR